MIRTLAAALMLLWAAAPVAEAATYRRTNRPIPGRYIVMFNDHVQAADVDRVASALARQHGGRLLGTMKHAMRGFGVRLSEAQARALMFHPFVAQVEEDGYVSLSGKVARPSFDFAAVRTAARAITPRTDSATACPWNTNGYFACEYANDDFWFLDRIDNSGLLYGYKAYGYNSMGTGVRAYVVDSGVWFGHTEFDTRVEAGANMTIDPDVNDPVGGAGEPDEEEPPITPDYSPANNPCNFHHDDPNIHGAVRHGTAVASLIGGNTRGAAKNVTIVPVKVFSCEDGLASQLAVARGLDWIQSDMAARRSENQPLSGPRALVNMSIFFDSTAIFPGHEYPDGQELCEDGQGGFTNCMSALEHEVNELVRKEIPVVTSANNQNNENCSTSPARLGYGGAFPTTYRTITVGASSYVRNANGTYTDIRFADSNYGACVSIWAPGARLSVAMRDESGQSTFFTFTGGGSSFASAIVSGAVARLLQQYPTLTAAQVWTELRDRAAQRSVQPADFDPSPTVTNQRLLYIRATE